MSNLALLVLRILLVLSPLDRPREQLPGWHEDAWQRGVRYLSIATDVAAAVTEACAGKSGCEAWAVPVLLGISFHESGYQPDVDSPTGCYRGPGHRSRCDGGASVSIFQLRAGGEEATLYRTNRKAAAREALRRAIRSWNASRNMDPALRFAIYAGGSRENATAQKRSRELWASIERAKATAGVSRSSAAGSP